MKNRMLVVGNTGVRLTLECERLPYSGENADGTTYFYSPDTKGGASAIALTRMGFDASLIACVGNDANGSKLISIFEKNGVDTRFVKKVSGAPTALTVTINETEAGARGIFYPGASALADAESVEEAFTIYPDGVLIRLDSPAEAVEAAEKFADEKSVPVYLSASELSSSSEPALPKMAEMFVSDAQSAAAITGILPSNPDSSLRAAFELSRKLEVRFTVFRMSNGCVYVYDGKYPKIITAGLKGNSFAEVFTPALIAEYLRREDINRAAEFAVHATKMWEARGETLTSIPTQSEVREDDGI